MRMQGVEKIRYFSASPAIVVLCLLYFRFYSVESHYTASYWTWTISIAWQFVWCASPFKLVLVCNDRNNRRRARMTGTTRKPERTKSWTIGKPRKTTQTAGTTGKLGKKDRTAERTVWPLLHSVQWPTHLRRVSEWDSLEFAKDLYSFAANRLSRHTLLGTKNEIN
jgi:hypothetical protein